MYLPKPYQEDDPERLHALIRAHEFATLVTEAEGVPFVSHLPLLLDADRGPRGMLLGHMARANPQWRDFDGERTALAIFHGPHCYVSPSWYVSSVNVPTWNYAVAHVHGAPRVNGDEDAVRGHLGRLVETFESGFEAPWSIDSLPEDYVAAMIKAVVAFEMPIERVEGKFKLNQRNEAGDHAAVRDVLAASENVMDRAVSGLMADRAEV